MRITLDTDTHTVEVHGAANYEQLTALVDSLVQQLKWPADAVQIVQRQPLAINTTYPEDRAIFRYFGSPYQVFCGASTTADPGTTGTDPGTTVTA